MSEHHRPAWRKLASFAVFALIAVGVLAIVSPAFRMLLPATPGWVLDTRWGQTWLPRLIASVADNPSCAEDEIAPGIAQSDRIDRRLDYLTHTSKAIRKDPAGHFLWDTPDGRFWVPYKRDFWSLAVVLAEQHENIYGEASRDGVRPGDIVIDAGAHIGLFTRKALEQGAKLVIAMEINPKTIDCFRRNLAQPMREGRVILVDKGVWNEPAVLSAGDVHAIDENLEEEELCSACIAVDEGAPAERSIEVRLTTIDNIVAALGLERVDFIKLDVENAEARALEGGLETLRRFEPRLAVAVENAEDIPAYVREVEAVTRRASPAYSYRCGTTRYSRETNTVVPEILHFSTPAKAARDTSPTP